MEKLSPFITICDELTFLERTILDCYELHYSFHFLLYLFF